MVRTVLEAAFATCLQRMQASVKLMVTLAHANNDSVIHIVLVALELGAQWKVGVARFSHIHNKQLLYDQLNSS